MPKKDIIDKLSTDISISVGNSSENDLSSISNNFNIALNNALNKFNMNSFDDSGFIKRMSDLKLNKEDDGTVKNILNGIKGNYMDIYTLNQNDLLMRRDIYNICKEMPEMRDVIYIIRDSIIEDNVASGTISRSFIFENYTDDGDSTTTTFESYLIDMEKRHNLPSTIKNSIIPNTLMIGDIYINVVPYSKLFAEIEIFNSSKSNYKESVLYNDIPKNIKQSFSNITNLSNSDNINYIKESIDANDLFISSNNTQIKNNMIDKDISMMLEHINVSTGISTLHAEYGIDGFKEMVYKEYKNSKNKCANNETHFMEYIDNYNNLPIVPDNEDEVISKKYNDIKGVYVNYLDALRMIPIYVGKRIIGYCYSLSSIDMQQNYIQPNGVMDLSFHQFTKDKSIVNKLSSLIIKSFDKKMLDNNIKLKNEIAEVIMAHKFTDGKLNFIFIPEEEIVRIKINEDDKGRGHSVLEPSVVPARRYLLLTLYNLLYTLNNSTTRIHYLRSSGINKNYSAQIQRTMRKFQSRRVSVDDIYSYTGALNKLGAMTEMVLPSGRGDFRAIDTQTIDAAPNPISVEFLEQQRRQAISGTGVPQFLVINAIDEVDFAKTLEMANARYLSTVSSYKIDFNDGLTRLYRRIATYETDFNRELIESFYFKFNDASQQDLNITIDMIGNFNQLVELVGSLKYSQGELQDEQGQATKLAINLRMELAKKYLPQLDFEMLEDIFNKIDAESTKDELVTKSAETDISDSEIEEFMNK